MGKRRWTLGSAVGNPPISGGSQDLSDLGRSAAQPETIEHPGGSDHFWRFAATITGADSNYRPAVDQKSCWECRPERSNADELRSRRPAASSKRKPATGAGMQPLCEFFMSPEYLHERMHLFLASDLEIGQQDLDSGEQIEPLVRLDEAMTLVDSGQIQDPRQSQVCCLRSNPQKSAG